MFSTKGQEVKVSDGVQRSLQPGKVYAHIHSASVRTSSKGDKKVLDLVLEGPHLPNFEGWAVDKNDQNGPKFKGQSSRVTATMWIDTFNETNPSKNEIMYKLTAIAIELGMRDDLDNIRASSIEGWVEQAGILLGGQNLYWFLKGTEEEYNGKTIVKLSLPKFKFASMDENKLDNFDKTNKYHYKALETKQVSSFSASASDDDLPF
jgi:hypothetical protein